MVAERVELAQLDDLDDLGSWIGEIAGGLIGAYGAVMDAKLKKKMDKRAGQLHDKQMALLDKKQGIDNMLADLKAKGLSQMNASQLRQAEIQLEVDRARADMDIAKIEQEKALNTIRGQALQDQLKANIADGMPIAQAQAIATQGMDASGAVVSTAQGGAQANGGKDEGKILGMKPLVFAGVAGGGALLVLGGLYFALGKD